MGRGRSKAGGGGSSRSGGGQIIDYPEAFEDGVNFQTSGDVDHDTRTVSSSLQSQWDSFTASYQTGMTRQELRSLMKDYDPWDDELYGYIRTSNSWNINKALYDPANADKSLDEIFTRQDRHGNYRDLETVQNLDKAINTHTTQADASFTRFCDRSAIQATYGLREAEVRMLAGVGDLDAKQMKQLNKALSGKTSYSNSYTSTSANRSMNAFGNPYARHSSGFFYERKISVPKGTKAYAVQRNAQESEVIFGRKMRTKLQGVTVADDGHIVLHEMFDGYLD